ncbi:MAG TPA: SRPBCC family protein [Methylomirabilota bacterium]|nr:SRPBCC family protein [Methylomirabilota bacterium]
MRSAMLAGTAVLALVASVPAQAAEVSKVIEAKGTVDKAWAALGDFCGIKDWHPAIANCVLSEKDGAKIRTLTTKDGGVLVEKMTQWDDAGHSYGYAILESPLPVANYVSTIAVKDAAGGAVSITWSSTFDPKGASEEDASKVIAGIYDAGLGALKAKIEAP